MALTSLKGCKLSIKIIYGEEIVKNIDKNNVLPKNIENFGVPWNRGMFNEFSALQ
jgi:hypothetical protein